MPAEITSTEYGNFPALEGFLEIPLETPAWEVDQDGYLSHFDGAPLVGENRVIPGRPGRWPVRSEIDENTFGLRMVFYGTHDYEGNAYADDDIDPIDGIRLNLRVFRANLLLPTAAAARPYEFHERTGDVWTGNVQVKPPLMLGRLGPTGARGVLTIKVPDGYLELDVP